MLISRRRDRPVRHLEWRIRLMGAGAILAMVGMYYQARWMIAVAIAVLLGGLLLRFLPERGKSAEKVADSEDNDS